MEVIVVNFDSLKKMAADRSGISCEEKDLQALWLDLELGEARREIGKLKARIRSLEDYAARVSRIVETSPMKKEGGCGNEAVKKAFGENQKAPS